MHPHRPTDQPTHQPTNPQVSKALESANHWQFDAFKLTESTDGHPLSALGFYAFHSAGLIGRFGFKAPALARYLRRVEDGYRVRA